MSLHLLICTVALAFATNVVAQTGLKAPKPGPKPPAANSPAKQPGKKPAAQDTASTDEAERGKIIERVFECLAFGLPQDWWRASVEIVEKGQAAWNEHTFESRYSYLTDAERTKPQDLKPCDAKEAAELTFSLNQFLEPEKRRWKLARLTFGRDGSFELKYDYGQ